MVYVPERGDIVHLDFSPQAGHEQAKRRPALVLSPSEYNRLVGLVVVVPITSKAKGYSFEVVLPRSLDTQGAILSDQIKSVDWRARNTSFLETAPHAVLDEVVARIAALLKIT